MAAGAQGKAPNYQSRRLVPAQPRLGTAQRGNV
jgi:hypothetical protein